MEKTEVFSVVRDSSLSLMLCRRRQARVCQSTVIPQKNVTVATGEGRRRPEANSTGCRSFDHMLEGMSTLDPENQRSTTSPDPDLTPSDPSSPSQAAPNMLILIQALSPLLPKQTIAAIPRPFAASSHTSLVVVTAEAIPDLNPDQKSSPLLISIGSAPLTPTTSMIGTAICKLKQLEAFVVGEINILRLNMCHGDRDVRRLNKEKGLIVAMTMDTERSEILMGNPGDALSAKAEDGKIWTFRVKAFNSFLPDHTIHVN